MAADIGAHMHFADLLLDEPDRTENRAFGTARAEPWRAGGHRLTQDLRRPPAVLFNGPHDLSGAGGIETGGRVRVTVELAKRPRSFFWPRLVNETHIATLAMARPCEDAFRYGLEALVLWLEEEHGFSRIDAYLLLGQLLEARCTAFVNPTFTYICKFPRRFLDGV